VIIDNFDIKGIPTSPHEAHSVLIIDANAMLPLACSVERFQTIARGHSKVLKRDCRVQNGKLYERSSLQIGGKASTLAGLPQPFRLFVAKTNNH
jgi:hypothetical protein